MTPLVDTHCHLDFPELTADRPGVLARAAAAGIVHMVTISTRIRRFAEIHAIAAENEGIVSCTVGTHPHQAGEEADIEVAVLEAAAAQPHVVGIGECGLDYFYDHAPRDVQADVFRRHIRVARETGLPLIIHSRDADEDMIRVLEAESRGIPYRGILHCFTGSAWLAERGVALGLHVSVSGIITFKKSDELRRIARDIVPRERLLVETDAPFLAPVPHRGAANEPSFVRHTAALAAETLGMSLDTLADLTTRNAARLFDRAAALAPWR